MNRTEFIGNLTKDCEIVTRGKDFNVAIASVAVKRDYKNKQGEYDTDFFEVEYYDEKAKILNQYCHKGDLVYLECSARRDNYIDKDGKKRNITKFIGSKVQKLSSKGTPKEETKVDNSEQVTEEKPEDFELPF